MSWGPDGPEHEQKSERTKAREAFFLEFAQVIRKEFPDIPLMVTGGFRSRVGMEKAVADGDCDMVGLGRPAVLNPSLPKNTIFNPEIKDQDATLYRKKNSPRWLMNKLGLSAVGAGMDTVRSSFLTMMTEAQRLTFLKQSYTEELGKLAASV